MWLGSVTPIVLLSAVLAEPASDVCNAGRKGSDSNPLSVGIVGLGLVGSELFVQLTKQAPRLLLEGIDLRVVAVATSRSMQLRPAAQPLKDLAEAKAATWSWLGNANLSALSEHMASQSRGVIVDCTASEAPTELYGSWLASGLAVVAANKLLPSGPIANYQAARRASFSARKPFFLEATVGAGLPVLSSLRELQRTGDSVQRVEGILSGTLSFLFNRLGNGTGASLSNVVAEAMSLGLTEPDPRDDLSGVDVQRKVVILARHCGLGLELEEVAVEPLLSPDLAAWRPSSATALRMEFLQKLKAEDAAMQSRLEQAHARGEVLRFVGTVDILRREAWVKLLSLPSSHPFAATQHTDNIVAITSNRYSLRPLVIQGPGAGAAVTAAGIFGDILKLA